MGAIKEVYGVEGELGDYTFHGRTDPGIIRDLAELWSAADPEAVVGRYEGETQPQVVHDLAAQLGTPDEAIDALVDDCIARYVELLADGGRAGSHRAAARHQGAGDGAGRRPARRPRPAHRQRRSGRAPQAGAHRASCRSSRSAPTAPTRRTGRSCRRWPCAAPRSSPAGASPARRSSIIGDTPADIECGAALGVKAIAVATGKHSVDELAAHAPDYLFDDFSDWRAAYEAILA